MMAEMSYYGNLLLIPGSLNPEDIERHASAKITRQHPYGLRAAMVLHLNCQKGNLGNKSILHQGDSLSSITDPRILCLVLTIRIKIKDQNKYIYDKKASTDMP